MHVTRGWRRLLVTGAPEPPRARAAAVSVIEGPRPPAPASRTLLVREGTAVFDASGPASPSGPGPGPRSSERAPAAMELRRLNPRTQKASLDGMRRYGEFHGRRDPAAQGAEQVTAFLRDLAVRGRVAGSTQNQALAALRFLYRSVLGQDLPGLEDLVRAATPQRLPVVLTRSEVRAWFERLEGVPRRRAMLLYGSGLRLMECCRLRAKDLDFDRNQITMRRGKGRLRSGHDAPLGGQGRAPGAPRACRPAARPGPRGGRGLGGASGCARPEAAEGRPRWGVAMVLPNDPHLRRTPERCAPPPPPSRGRSPAGRTPCRPDRANPEAGHVPHLPSFLRDAPPGGWHGPPDAPGAPRPSGRLHHDDLHARPQPGSCRGRKPGGPSPGPMSVPFSGSAQPHDLAWSAGLDRSA